MFKRSLPLLALGLLGFPTADTLAAPPAAGGSRPREGKGADAADFTGQVQAVQSVELRARVTGYLTKVAFKEGSKVEKGQLLFEIDPRPYQAAAEQARAELALAEATLKLREAELARARRLVEQKGMSREEFDKVVAAFERAKAALVAAKAAYDAAQLNLEFTKVRAPISGRIGRACVTPGNLVKGDETKLATLASTDPMYVYFDVDEKSFVRLRRQLAGKEKEARLPLHMGLAGEKGFPHEGVLDMVDNRVDPKTGALRMRGVFPNKDGTLVPGMFARVRMDLGKR
jgi:multidrug efflux system membrane fusion protein